MENDFRGLVSKPYTTRKDVNLKISRWKQPRLKHKGKKVKGYGESIQELDNGRCSTCVVNSQKKREWEKKVEMKVGNFLKD